jgi:hypothetical protein
MLQRLNSWGRKTLLGCALLTVLAVSVMDSKEVPGKVMQLTGFEVLGLKVSTYEDPCEAIERSGMLKNCFY